MFRHLLVPLDGSHLAEASLPAAAYLAQELGAWVTLIHLIERNAPKEIHSEHHLSEPEEAEAYLAEVARRTFPAGVKVETHVHTEEVSNVARSLVAHSSELQPDLVVMCTHGKSGVRDLLFGSIAQQVISQGVIPVLLIHPQPDQPAEFHCGRMLAPLDGGAEHELGLSTATELAKACHAFVYLLNVVPTFGTLKGEQAAASRMLPGATSAALDIAEQTGEEYLRKQVGGLQAAGLKAAGEVKRGDPAERILETAEELHPDLIVLGTHGKAGADAFWSGSVTPKVATRVKIPVLLIPVIRN